MYDAEGRHDRCEGWVSWAFALKMTLQPTEPFDLDSLVEQGCAEARKLQVALRFRHNDIQELCPDILSWNPICLMAEYMRRLMTRNAKNWKILRAFLNTQGVDSVTLLARGEFDNTEAYKAATALCKTSSFRLRYGRLLGLQDWDLLAVIEPCLRPDWRTKARRRNTRIRWQQGSAHATSQVHWLLNSQTYGLPGWLAANPRTTQQ